MPALLDPVLLANAVAAGVEEVMRREPSYTRVMTATLRTTVEMEDRSSTPSLASSLWLWAGNVVLAWDLR